MNFEISDTEAGEIQPRKIENLRETKPEHEMSPKELRSSVKEIFNKEAERYSQMKDISGLVKNYIDDLKTRSDCPETISSDAINPTKLEVQSPEKVAEKREDFNNSKAELRDEWEKLNNREWPKYKEDVVNAEGKIIRKAGDNFDAHHIQPLKLGGENEARNITPLDMSNHREVHSSAGSCKTLVENVMGGKENDTAGIYG